MKLIKEVDRQTNETNSLQVCLFSIDGGEEIMVKCYVKQTGSDYEWIESRFQARTFKESYEAQFYALDFLKAGLTLA